MSIFWGKTRGYFSRNSQEKLEKKKFQDKARSILPDKKPHLDKILIETAHWPTNHTYFVYPVIQKILTNNCKKIVTFGGLYLQNKAF